MSRSTAILCILWLACVAAAQGYRVGDRQGKTPEQIVRMGRVGWYNYLDKKGLMQAHVDEGNADATFTECENLLSDRMSRSLTPTITSRLSQVLKTVRSYKVESLNIEWQEAGGGNAFDPDDGDSMGVADLRFQIVNCLTGRSSSPKGSRVRLIRNLRTKLKSEDKKIETYRHNNGILEGVQMEGLKRRDVVNTLHARNHHERRLLADLIRQLKGLPPAVAILVLRSL
ncbi:MAG TPA: hypothetical protein VG944_24870 [Fimbriimonas sp.]|nr:hypothetical protein [Fimbriimonas sp.]